jgi:hypothetical protein
MQPQLGQDDLPLTTRERPSPASALESEERPPRDSVPTAQKTYGVFGFHNFGPFIPQSYQVTKRSLPLDDTLSAIRFSEQFLGKKRAKLDRYVISEGTNIYFPCSQLTFEMESHICTAVKKMSKGSISGI